MPTAKKKLAGIGLFTRQADGSVGGPGASPRPGVVGLPATPAPQFPRELAQLQPPPEIVTARQELTAVRSIPVPKGGRFASGQPPTATMSLPPTQHFHPVQRTRTTSSDTGRDPPRPGQNAWEDSTVASMFGDNEGRTPSDRLRGHPAGLANHNRHYSDAAYQRAHPDQPGRNRQSGQEEDLPFVIGDNGLLKVISQPVIRGGSSMTPLSGAIQTVLTHEPATIKAEDLYSGDHQPYDTPTKLNPLRRTKLPHRDAREARRDSSAGGYSSDAQSLGLSPERPTEVGNQIERVRLEERVQERARRDRERHRELERYREGDLEREHELHHKRSTVFENLTPVLLDEPTFDNTRAAVLPTASSDGSPRSITEALQRTPRGPRQPLPSLPQTALAGGGSNIAPRLGESSLARGGARRVKETGSKEKKRRIELDYNDAELASMSYSDLRAQSFDYDPQKVAVQQQQQNATMPSESGTLEERLEFYKTKGGLDQHQFFTRISVDEWEEAGDWFLTRFSDVVEKMRKARKSKRQLVATFEADVAAREEAVRGKMEGIARTLEDLKQEGQTMMAGKDADLA